MSKAIRLKPEIWRRVEETAKKAGYSSAVEFVEHAVEKELSRLEEAEDRAEVERRLKGLGYLE